MNSQENISVSIIVVSYNHEQFLKQALESICNQTYKNWELIVGDDCSADNSVAKIEEFLQDRQIQAKRNFHQENTGLCRMLNECVNMAQGTWIKILAADDFLHPEYLENIMQYVQGSGYKAAYSNAQMVNEFGILGDKLVKIKLPEGNIFERLLSGNFIPALTMIFKREVYEELGPFDEKIWIEDWEYWLRIAQRHTIGALDRVLAYYRVHSNNVSNNPKKVFAEWDIVMKYEENGQYKKSANRFVMITFLGHPLHNELSDIYGRYKHRNKIIYFTLRNNIRRGLVIRLNRIFRFA